MKKSLIQFDSTDVRGVITVSIITFEPKLGFTNQDAPSINIWIGYKKAVNTFHLAISLLSCSFHTQVFVSRLRSNSFLMPSNCRSSPPLGFGQVDKWTAVILVEKASFYLAQNKFYACSKLDEKVHFFQN